MRMKQIFSAYNNKSNSQDHSAFFCPSCGNPCRIEPIDGKNRYTCPKCGFIHYKNPLPAVSVLITKNDQVLLCKRVVNTLAGGKWCLPCGFIEFDEDFLTAAAREVREETGLVIEIQSIINVVSNYLTPQVHSLVIVLLAIAAGGSIQPGDDIQEVRWYPLAGPLPELAFEADRFIIERYQSGLTGLPIDSDYKSKQLMGED